MQPRVPWGRCSKRKQDEAGGRDGQGGSPSGDTLTCRQNVRERRAPGAGGGSVSGQVEAPQLDSLLGSRAGSCSSAPVPLLSAPEAPVGVPPAAASWGGVSSTARAPFPEWRPPSRELTSVPVGPECFLHRVQSCQTRARGCESPCPASPRPLGPIPRVAGRVCQSDPAPPSRCLTFRPAVTRPWTQRALQALF